MTGTPTAPDVPARDHHREPALPLRRLGPAVALGEASWAIPGGASATLIAALVAQASPDGKVAALTALTATGAVASAAGTVLGGALSDRTRSRWGRRSPWLLGSAALAVVALTAAGLSGDRLVLAGIGFALFQLAIGTFVAVVSVLIPDHVDRDRVGRASAFAGSGYLVGQTAGGVLGGLLVTRPATGLLIAPWTMAVAAVVVALLVPAGPGRPEDGPRPRFSPRDLLPPTGRDFWLAFTGRFLFVLAVLMITTFQLYLLTDYLGVPTARAGELIGTAMLLVGALSLVTVVVAGVASDRLGRMKPFVAGAPLLLAAGMVPVLVSPGVGTEMVFFGAVGLTLGTYLAVNQALMVAVLPDPDTAGRDLGFLTIGSTLPAVLAPVVGGLLATTAGYLSIFIAALVSAVVAAVAVLGIRSVR